MVPIKVELCIFVSACIHIHIHQQIVYQCFVITTGEMVKIQITVVRNDVVVASSSGLT